MTSDDGASERAVADQAAFDGAASSSEQRNFNAAYGEDASKGSSAAPRRAEGARVGSDVANRRGYSARYLAAERRSPASGAIEDPAFRWAAAAALVAGCLIGLGAVAASGGALRAADGSAAATAPTAGPGPMVADAGGSLTPPLQSDVAPPQSDLREGLVGAAQRAPQLREPSAKAAAPPEASQAAQPIPIPPSADFVGGATLRLALADIAGEVAGENIDQMDGAPLTDDDRPESRLESRLEARVAAAMGDDMRDRSTAAPTAAASPPSNATPPWRAHAEPSPAGLGDGPALAIVIDDLGPDRAASLEVLDIDAPITVAVLPRGDAAAAVAAEARRRGREVLLHLPMEPVGPEDPGPDAILTTASSEENAARLERHLAAFDGYVGVNNHMGSAATANAEVMRRVLLELNARGLMFLDSRTASDSWGWRLARRYGMPAAFNQTFLDTVRDHDAILARLDEAAAAAREHGVSVAIGHPHPETIASLRFWLAKRGYGDVTLVPITTVARRLSPR